eukprot:scaffold91683_cov52-Attheya_sp.AAC.4
MKNQCFELVCPRSINALPVACCISYIVQFLDWGLLAGGRAMRTRASTVNQERLRLPILQNSPYKKMEQSKQ